MGHQALVFGTWDQDSPTLVGPSGTSHSFDISDTTGGGVLGGWGPNKESFIYIRRQSSSQFFMSEVATPGTNVTGFTTSDLFDVSAYTRYSSPRYVPATSDYIAMIAAPSPTDRRHFYVFDRTGAVVTDVIESDFTTNPYDDVTLKYFTFSADATMMAFFVDNALSIGTTTGRFLIYDRATFTLLAQVDADVDSGTGAEPQFSEDGTILFWVNGGVLDYLTNADWTTVISQPEVGTDDRGVARFWNWPRLSPDKTVWSNHWNYQESPPLTYYSRAHFFNFDFTHLAETDVGGFATTWYKGDFDETGMWWAGGDNNINGFGFSWERDPWTADLEGGDRGQPYFMRPFQPY